jgi:hypothetical protein
LSRQHRVDFEPHLVTHIFAIFAPPAAASPAQAHQNLQTVRNREGLELVDIRWAAKLGYYDKGTGEWVENGRELYLRSKIEKKRERARMKRGREDDFDQTDGAEASLVCVSPRTSQTNQVLISPPAIRISDPPPHHTLGGGLKAGIHTPKFPSSQTVVRPPPARFAPTSDLASCCLFDAKTIVATERDLGGGGVQRCFEESYGSKPIPPPALDEKSRAEFLEWNLFASGERESERRRSVGGGYEFDALLWTAS